MTKKQYIGFVAGRSGGHILPALTLAQQYKEKYPETKIIFFSTNTKLDRSLLDKQKIVDHRIHISLGNFPYKKIYKYPLFLWQLNIAFLRSFYYLVRYRPDNIIALGGYISIPICIVAWLLKIPRELFELNVIPGKATCFLAPIIPHIAVCFDQTKKHLSEDKCYTTTYPVHFCTNAKTISKKDALAALTFLSMRKTIMILGGSQGSAFINHIAKEWVNENPEYQKKIQIIHQTGLLHDKYELEEFYANYSIPALVFDYYDELEYCYQAADLIICRSGAGTLFEVNFFKKPCITIPLETTITSHQYYNAKAMESNSPSFFTVIQQKELKATRQLLNKAIAHHLQKQE